MGTIEDFTAKPNVRPGSASVTVQLVVQVFEPLRLYPLNTEPGTADEPFCHSMVCASSASEAKVGRSVSNA